jgi:short-subunit dehydrogenase
MVRTYRSRVAVITGAGSGLGQALAKELAARNCNLALVDLDSSAIAGTKKELARPGIVVTDHCADVGCEQSLKLVARDVKKDHGAVDVLINNAGVSASASFLNTSATDFERVMQVNFWGVLYGCRVFLPLLQERSEGQILNVSSCFAWLGYPRKTAYASSKAAIRAFSESLRTEIAESGVGVTVLYAGPLHTSLISSGVSDSAERLEREQKFLRNRGLSLERVASRCLDRLVKNPGRIVIGADYHLLDVLSRLSPSLAARLIGFASQRAGF